MAKEYYAHIVNDEGKYRFQLVKDHLFAVAEMARHFLKDVGLSDFGYYAGLFHDLGKYMDARKCVLYENDIRCLRACCLHI